MSRSRDLVAEYYNRDTSLHKPGVIPKSSRIISPITANRHKYELKQRIWPKKTIESWFANHSQTDRRAVYDFLDTLYQADTTNEKDQQRQRSPTRRYPSNVERRLQQRRLSQSSRPSSKRELGEVLESFESFRLSPSAKEKSNQETSTTAPLPQINGPKDENTTRPVTAANTDDKASRRYLSQTWRVINPRDDVEQNVRPDTNTSSFFKYTKKTYPEYFFIHPDWY
ncbi:unnamed protein product [Adineta ricciae]|uniref:Uncharacterized protein n=1 Tax=Adineta ricciae TaxID=249248 RepID=A0A814E504_ADIRI|nr:unnamed protein product [Adineta ricciae]CAF0967176.1 unnamed protein product [Adineta ricciae]